jgi:hypothetical protein
VSAWRQENQRHLAAALADVRDALERHAEGRREGRPSGAAPAIAALSPGNPPPALLQLASLFELSPFARALLVLCAGMELDATIAPLCAKAQGDPQRGYPTFGLALAALPGANWDDLAPGAPLRHWRLIEVTAGPTLAASPLKIEERVLCFLTGIDQPDERLAGLVTPVEPTADLVPSHHALAARLAGAWSRTAGSDDFPVVQLAGADPASQRAVAAAACAALGMSLHAIATESLPGSPRELDDFLRLWQREVALGAGALLVEDEGETEPAREAIVARLVEGLPSPLILASRERRRARQRPLLSLDVGKPSPCEQRELWRAELGDAAPDLAGAVDALVSQFDLSAPVVRAAYAGALGSLAEENEEAAEAGRELAPALPTTLADALWESCRSQARPRLESLAHRIEPSAGWDDLILPPRERGMLQEIALQVRHRARVYEEWGFAARGGRGLGVAALFSGGSGTGKTLAAEVLAGELRLDLFRIDLALAVSKYIGETEKNLRRIFDAAEEGGAILLFDEADALFGKRGEVKDSHDRYANLEVSYLLQRMESYRGLAILTTNLKDSLDAAFLRRLRFIVHFPFPDAAEREAIWRRAFPAATPTAGLEPEKLARLNVAGGSIRNIALAAAFLAADADEPVQMKHLLRAARSEYGKIEKPLTDAEVRGWV